MGKKPRQSRSAAAVRKPALVPSFRNKAGQYELARIEDHTAYYRFTNHYGQKTEAAMPVITWRRLQEHAGQSPEPAATQ